MRMSGIIVVICLALLAAKAEDDNNTDDAVIRLRNNGEDYDVYAEIWYKVNKRQYKHTFTLRQTVTSFEEIQKGTAEIELKVWLVPFNKSEWFKLLEEVYPVPTDRCLTLAGTVQIPRFARSNCDTMQPVRNY